MERRGTRMSVEGTPTIDVSTEGKGSKQEMEMTLLEM